MDLLAKGNAEEDWDPNRLWVLLSEVKLAKRVFCYFGGYYFLSFAYYLLVLLYCFLASGITGIFSLDFYYDLEVVVPAIPNSPLTGDVDYGNLALNSPPAVDDGFFY